MTNKETAVQFLKMITSGRVREAYEQFLHSEFKHHNPYFKGDRESLMVAMEENHKHFPNKVFDIQRVMENDQEVAVHSKVVLAPSLPPISVVHILKFEDGKVIEEWDIGQQVPENNPNENGMF